LWYDEPTQADGLPSPLGFEQEPTEKTEMTGKTGVTAFTVLSAFIIARPAVADDVSSAKVQLVETNWKGVQKLVAAHKGQVVVIDIWTTTCAGCIKKFPEFVALQKLYKGKIALISVNCDYDGIPGKPPKFYRADVLKFLQKQNATFENVMLNVSLLKFLDEAKLESTPAMYVYDKTGKLAKRFDNDKAEREADEFTMTQVRELVAKLIKK
jgi:thiol-disulfide isomerase/thioredoxin